jgi:nucleotide-binding universal stress UspA family protein
MKKLRNILFYAAPGAATAPALARAAALAKKSDAVLTVAGVLEEIPRDLWMLVPPIGTGPVAELAAAEMLERLEQLVEPLRRRGVDIDTEVLLGDPCRELVRAIERRRHDLLVVGAGERAASRCTLVRLLKVSPCPVSIVRNAGRTPAGNILAAIEPGQGDETARLLSRKVVETAAAVARLEAARLEVLCVSEVPLDGILPQRAGGCANAAVEELLGQLDLPAPVSRLHLERGRLAPALTEAARRAPVDLVVLGVAARSRARGWFCASRLETLLEELPCSLLAVRQQMADFPAKQEAA